MHSTSAPASGQGGNTLGVVAGVDTGAHHVALVAVKHLVRWLDLWLS